MNNALSAATSFLPKKSHDFFIALFTYKNIISAQRLSRTIFQKF